MEQHNKAVRPEKEPEEPAVSTNELEQELQHVTKELSVAKEELLAAKNTIVEKDQLLKELESNIQQSVQDALDEVNSELSFELPANLLYLYQPESVFKGFRELMQTAGYVEDDLPNLKVTVTLSRD